MPQQRKGLSWNPWNAPKSPSLRDSLLVRSKDGSWYRLSRQFPVENDSFLSDKSLRVLLRDRLELQGREMWIARLTPFNSANGLHNVVPGLILTVVEEAQGIKYARRELITGIVPWATQLQKLHELLRQALKGCFSGVYLVNQTSQREALRSLHFFLGG